MNIFRLTHDGSLDRKYLRVCAVYRLLIRQSKIGKERAIELLNGKCSNPCGIVELWLNNKLEGRP